MNPRALAAWSTACLVVSLATTNPVYRVLVILAAANLLVVAARPGLTRRPLAVSLLLAVVAASLLNTLLGHGGIHVVATIPTAIPVFGGPLTLEGLASGAGIGLGLAAAVLAVAPLSLCIEPELLVAALPRALSRTGAALGASLNLVPGIVRGLTAIGEAQRLRGLPAGLRSAGTVLVPAVLTALEDSLQLAESMEARAYGSGPRTTYAVVAWTARDSLLTIVPVAAATWFVAAHAFGLIADWYPYPALTVPAVSAPAVAACLLLALPGLGWLSPHSPA